MSDFVYSKHPVRRGELGAHITSIYHNNPPPIEEFHGKWGSLAVSRNLYNGFDPLETEEHILIVLGGPLLTFAANNFLLKEHGTEGSRMIYDRWLFGSIRWDEDLSGPFLVLIIDKRNGAVSCITDLMSFIPVYSYRDPEGFALSSHVDVLARSLGLDRKKDLVSQIDFVLHGVVTFPYTTYKEVRQEAPATVHSFESKETRSEAYWYPEEKHLYNTLKEAATNLRETLQEYIERVTREMNEVAQFISGGEDSRILAALLPEKCNKDAFIFLDRANREGEIAKKAAAAYGLNYSLALRSRSHYLDILPDSVDLIGSDSEYAHVHTYGFHETCKLTQYPAVFGGLLSDALLKGSHIRKKNRFSWAPHVKDPDHDVRPINSPLFSKEVLQEVHERRLAHRNFVKELRPTSFMEWFDLWPSSMNYNICNIHGNRRLFRSYEPFMSQGVVKLSAAVPQDWKLNRRLFHKMARPFFKNTRWLLHTKGHLPYFPSYVNRWLIFPVNYYRKFTDRKKYNEGPWPKWNRVQQLSEWDEAIKKYSDGLEVIGEVLEEKDLQMLFSSLRTTEKRRLLQVLYVNHKDFYKIP